MKLDPDYVGWLAIFIASAALAVSILDDCQVPPGMEPPKDYPPGYAAPALLPDGEAMAVST